ncbi:Ger(x)C family spore germination protein [Paenibacillus sp. CF384]|uniref:Ger(x)C family spore germination protein n=1 Tax=Paenibacillus sp. CF384 TaxID=1884382 RepID=UPI00089A6B71|nr:Ger(x)C family spore germination protein [Paenibacillus sp. CF384]SDX50138.1 spore germination protein KC [Paenibacillus sp. CF384]
MNLKMKPILCIGLLFMVFITSGCWDRTEINDLAFILGTAFDVTEEGETLLSLQVAIPSSGMGGSGQQERFFVLSATGKNANEAFQKLQNQSSRRLFTSHRSVIFISEAFGKQGINEVLDVFTHDPRQRLKTYIMVVRGGQGQEVLRTKYPFEQVPTEAVKEMEALGGNLVATLRDFFIEATSEGINPVTGVIEEDVHSTSLKGTKNKLFSLMGSAVFKDLKVVGFLDQEETNGLLWATNRMKKGRVTTYLPQYGGSVGVIIDHSKRKITSQVNGDAIKVTIQVQGQASLVENNTHLDVSRPNNLELIQKSMEKSVEMEIRKLLVKVQKIYKVDSIGIGQDIYRNDPKAWKQLKNQWDRKYPEVEVSIRADLSINGAGMAGAPLQLKDKEVMK